MKNLLSNFPLSAKYPNLRLYNSQILLKRESKSIFGKNGLAYSGRHFRDRSVDFPRTVRRTQNTEATRGDASRRVRPDGEIIENRLSHR